jgi:hypothetical protein
VDVKFRLLRAYPRNDQKVAIQFIDHVLPKLPFQVEQVQTDNAGGSNLFLVLRSENSPTHDRSFSHLYVVIVDLETGLASRGHIGACPSG